MLDESDAIVYVDSKGMDSQHFINTDQLYFKQYIDETNRLAPQEPMHLARPKGAKRMSEPRAMSFVKGGPDLAEFLLLNKEV